MLSTSTASSASRTRRSARSSARTMSSASPRPPSRPSAVRRFALGFDAEVGCVRRLHDLGVAGLDRLLAIELDGAAFAASVRAGRPAPRRSARRSAARSSSCACADAGAIGIRPEGDVGVGDGVGHPGRLAARLRAPGDRDEVRLRLARDLQVRLSPSPPSPRPRAHGRPGPTRSPAIRAAGSSRRAGCGPAPRRRTSCAEARSDPPARGRAGSRWPRRCRRCRDAQANVPDGHDEHAQRRGQPPAPHGGHDPARDRGPLVDGGLGERERAAEDVASRDICLRAGDRAKDTGQMSADQPRISVCVPAYNAEPYIDATLDSVLGQSERDIEVIVVDDRSRDATLEMVRARDDERLQVHANDHNLGAVPTVNRALALYPRALPEDPPLRRLAGGRLPGEVWPTRWTATRRPAWSSPRAGSVLEPGSGLAALWWANANGQLHRGCGELAECNPGGELFDRWLRQGFPDQLDRRADERDASPLRRRARRPLLPPRRRLPRRRHVVRVLRVADAAFLDEPPDRFRTGGPSLSSSLRKTEADWLERAWVYREPACRRPRGLEQRRMGAGHAAQRGASRSPRTRCGSRCGAAPEWRRVARRPRRLRETYRICAPAWAARRPCGRRSRLSRPSGARGARPAPGAPRAGAATPPARPERARPVAAGKCADLGGQRLGASFDAVFASRTLRRVGARSHPGSGGAPARACAGARSCCRRSRGGWSRPSGRRS